MEKREDSEKSEATLSSFLKQTLRKYSDLTALIFKENNNLKSITYGELDLLATKLSIAFIDLLNIKKQTHIALISNNRPEWLISNIAIQYTGAVDIPRASDTPQDILLKIIKHSDAKFAIVENEEVFKNIEPLIKDLDAIIIIDEIKTIDKGKNIYTLKELIEYGEKNLDKASLVIERINSVSPDDTASIIYTSGTVGEPKGVLIDQSNYLHNIKYVPKCFYTEKGYVFLSVLPSWHAYERQVEYAMLNIGGIIAYSNILTLKQDFEEIKPDLVAFIPQIWVSLYKVVMRKIQSENAFKRFLVLLLIKASKIYMKQERLIKNEEPEYIESIWFKKQLKKYIAFILRALYFPVKKLADVIFFSKLRKLLGGNLKIAISGAGALPEEIDEFFSAAGVNIYEGYGLTEAMVVVFEKGHFNFKIKTVGKALPEIEFKTVKEDGTIAKPGEIGVLLIKGPNVTKKGYYKNPELTAKVIDKEGFFYTGDLAKSTIDNYVKIIGRNDDIIVLTNGEKVNPVPIENELSANPLIDTAVVIGDKKPFLAAHIYLNRLEVEAFARERGIKYANLKELEKNEEILNYLADVVLKITGDSKKFSNHEVVRRIMLHIDPIPQGLLSQTRKLKRNLFNEYYSKENSEIYGG